MTDGVLLSIPVKGAGAAQAITVGALTDRHGPFAPFKTLVDESSHLQDIEALRS